MAGRHEADRTPVGSPPRGGVAGLTGLRYRARPHKPNGPRNPNTPRTPHDTEQRNPQDAAPHDVDPRTPHDAAPHDGSRTTAGTASRRGLFGSLAAFGLTAAGCSFGGPGGGGGAIPTATATAVAPTTRPPMTGGPTTAPTATGTPTTMPTTPGTPGAPGTPGPSPTASPPPPAGGGAGAATPAFLRGRDPVVHLLNRATFGPTPELVAEVKAAGVGAWLDRQLDPASIGDGTVDAVLGRFPFLAKTGRELHAIEGDIDYKDVIGLAVASIARMTWSNRQLLERMVDFWQSHVFNKGYPNDNLWRDSFPDDREVIRPNALGRFADLLLAETTSPAMIRRLNADRSTVRALNENLGRELLELHTVGVGAGYGQDGVLNSARILTGISIDAESKKYAFKSKDHYVGPVQVLDFSSPNGSAEGGEAVMKAYLDHLAHHPATAAYLTRKLATYFVADDPPQSLCDMLAQTYLANDTAIAPVLKALFTSAEFGQAVGLRTRRPLEDIVATLRVLGIGPPASGTEPVVALYWMANDMGMAPLAWPAPDGYPLRAERWVSASATIGRWNMHRNLLNGWYPKGLGTPAVNSLLGDAPPAAMAEVVDVLARRLVFQPLAPEHGAALATFLGDRGSRKPADNEYLVGQLGSLILDSPYHVYG
ncbi:MULTISPECIES: DUF1800 domain-containing protein [unclassified Parafrankia]|uniref:DUF1800 domain-containing protein n=1 Tax=unclassified Parafrankia TaxID=2994368 RepID=UPI000DA548B7|nr:MULTISPECIES: DUF1800 domain-containing protein [unclassified Parafrankia]TCJ35937.1 DUF1800 domain-containing protein [Parafrankia sp. BMG5.11]SQD95526.1 conserved hypothetical protein [Parafrankia sp. Ea1.12]